MKTLIELYDERAIENIIGPETFHPERVIYLCPSELFAEKKRFETLKHFFQIRNLPLELDFIECSMYQADAILQQLLQISSKYPDCVLDITGGTDAALFAGGMFCQITQVPAFTYSRKQNRFYNIQNAPFADQVPCTIEYSVESFFQMAGGILRKGRLENQILAKYMHFFQPFFNTYLKYRKEWPEFITFMTRISHRPYGDETSLTVSGNYVQKGEHGSKVSANPNLLKELARIGLIRNLQIIPNESLRFVFLDEQVRFWLRDVGCVLELYIYKACIDAGIFSDVVYSAIVDWDGTVNHSSVSNEIDVVASKGVIPLFISCKACDIKTEALNELAILRDRFGGKGAKSAIITTEHCSAPARHRAAQLGITVIDLEELENDSIVNRLKVMMKVIIEL